MVMRADVITSPPDIHHLQSEQGGSQAIREVHTEAQSVANVTCWRCVEHINLRGGGAPGVYYVSLYLAIKYLAVITKEVCLV